jgi:hypothetical protein
MKRKLSDEQQAVSSPALTVPTAFSLIVNLRPTEKYRVKSVVSEVSHLPQRTYLAGMLFVSGTRRIKRECAVLTGGATQSKESLQ